MILIPFALRGGLADGYACDLMVFGAYAPGATPTAWRRPGGLIAELADSDIAWPEYLFASRALAETVCTAETVAGWDPDAVARAFVRYRRTDETDADGRRIYTPDPMEAGH